MFLVSGLKLGSPLLAELKSFRCNPRDRKGGMELSPAQRLPTLSAWGESAERSDRRRAKTKRTACSIFACSHFAQRILPTLKTPL